MQAENKDNMVAGAGTLGIHALLLLILFLSVLRTPLPPMGSGSGVVLNLGFVDEGSGDVQTLNPASDAPSVDEAKPQETVTETVQPHEEPVPEEPIDNKENWLSADEETGVEAKREEQAREVKKPEHITPKKPVEDKKPAEETPQAEYKAPSSKNGTAAAGGNNNGDREGKVGDQGNPNGDINAKALYGNPGEGGPGAGGKGGTSLEMTGWKMDFKINMDNSDENGRIRFKIVVDDQGEVIKIETLEKSVSTDVVNYYKRQIENGSFIKDRNNARTAQNSTGYLTIIIRSK